MGEAVIIPAWVLPSYLGLVGLLIGSFLNVVVWRVPRGESVVRPRSACPRCGHPLAARDNVPVVSWLLLHGRCRYCSTPISRRYPLVELACGALFVGVGVWLGPTWSLPAYLYLSAVSLALVLIDLDVRRLPDAIVLPSYAVVIALLAIAVIAGEAEWGDLGRAVAAAGILFVVYFALMMSKPGGMGFGDVKLAGVLGLALGWIGWGALIVGGFGAFLLGGLFSIGLLLSGRATRGTGIPFGPWMILGAAIGLLAGGDVWEWYVGLLS